MNGLVLVDKPRGPTSARVTQDIQELADQKAGHCGTLDPDVSGVLPVLLGKGLKLLEYLQKHDKEYICLAKTGKKLNQKTVWRL